MWGDGAPSWGGDGLLRLLGALAERCAPGEYQSAAQVSTVPQGFRQAVVHRQHLGQRAIAVVGQPHLLPQRNVRSFGAARLSLSRRISYQSGLDGVASTRAPSGWICLCARKIV